MTFQVTREQRASSTRDGTIVVLTDGAGTRAEVWPALGCNCYRWVTGGHEVLYADPQIFGSGRPTRSGIPVLFPFPNRIRAGRFTWQGKEYEIPPGDQAGKNAIHGFVVQKPWRIID